MAGGARIDRFNYFVTFYSLILGLALTELLSGFAHQVPGRSNPRFLNRPSAS
jgi:hypothetical protein